MPVLIASFYFFYFALIGVHVIFVPKILAMVGYDPLHIGIILASAPLVRFAMPFLFLQGFRLGQQTFFTSLALMLLGAAGFYPSLTHFYPLLGANILFGIGISLILPYIEVIALEHIGKERYGRIRLFGSFGFIAVALVLVKFLTTPYVGIDFLIAMALLTLAFGALIGMKQSHTPSSECSSQDEACRFSIVKYIPLWIGFFLMQVSFGPFYNFFTIYATDHGVSLDTTVWLWSFGVIAEIAMFYFQGPLLRGNLGRILQLTALVTALRWLIVALFPDSTFLLFASQSLHAFSFALFHSAAIGMLFHLHKARRLAQQFFFGISYGLGGFIGAVGAGALYQYTPSLLFVGGAIAALGATIAFSVNNRS
ncbi:MAG: MFS transporter [Sulfuricurvum sp.]|uniref:MFS transporter n=1 Tax=Sulfuricurvum sp. TaxID=2025608 RepID=UPI00260BE138|nr:MFS transporter [Sulfuricurvum sp.]MDD5160913.1 MFS transporter [Sulfuricurvum sp.]